MNNTNHTKGTEMKDATHKTDHFLNIDPGTVLTAMLFAGTALVVILIKSL